MNKITPFLWFDTQAEEAMHFYTSLFKNSKINGVSYYGDGGPRPSGMVLTASFELDGQPVIALNGGPEYHFTEAFSFYVSCESQAEVDELWGKLVQEGEEGPCGWLKDKFGLSWQIVPNQLMDYIGGPDPARAAQALAAMFKMKKLDIAEIQQAYEQG